MYHPRHLQHHKEQMHRHACTCTQVLAYTPAVLARTHARTQTHARTHIHTHACMHTHTCTHTRTHTHARVHTHTPHIRTQTHTHARAQMHARAHARTCTHTHTHTRAHTHERTRTHARTHALAGARTHTHTHTFTRTHARAHTGLGTHAHTHISMHARQLSLGPTLWPGDILFYRLACVHMCVWHKTTGIALYLGPKSCKSSTEPIFRINFLPGSIVHSPLHAFQIRCRNSFGKGEFWQI
jgi:hypothetical protein